MSDIEDEDYDEEVEQEEDEDEQEEYDYDDEPPLDDDTFDLPPPKSKPAASTSTPTTSTSSSSSTVPPTIQPSLASMASSSATRRLAKDLQALVELDPSIGFKASPLGDNLYDWSVHLFFDDGAMAQVC
eukprot:TRINITY_DN2654_c0_g1_i2.p1 TRINITY_DN2654_c0_g1~~TRINITY_DN2654_c0_g1_i2.p1  ORF type:complete len:129 (+),score=44.56 TRINITY_DN2654_c0_g1_i2:438-824(+)